MTREERENLIKHLKYSYSIGADYVITDKDADEIIKALEQEPKTGHWIISPNDCFAQCSRCGLHGDKGTYKHYRWCPNCGAKMVEPQESEE